MYTCTSRMVSKRKGRARLGNEAPVCEQQEHLDEKRSAMATRYDRLDAVYIMQSTPRLCWLCSKHEKKKRVDQTHGSSRRAAALFFFFRLLIVLFIIIIITHQSVENERLKKKKGKARDELTPLVTPYQCTVAHVRENTWTWPPLRGCRCGSVCVWTKWREWMRVRCCWRARAVDYHCCKLHTRSLAVRNRKRMLFLFFQSRFFNLRQLHLILKLTRTNLYRKISISNIFRREWKLFVKESCSFLPRRIFFS